MTPRVPRFDFSDLDPRWGAEPEIAMIWNATSAITPEVEVWLNKVMMRARKRLSPGADEVRNLIDSFVQQESNHHRMHHEFNLSLKNAGYTMNQGQARMLKQELAEILDKRSLAFNAAYCAGFECFSLFMSKFVYEAAEDLFPGGDLAGCDMWRWHMAEEFEHRSVCHRVFAAISGNYFVRMQGFISAFSHLNNHIVRVTEDYLQIYRAGMTAEERRQSVARERAYKRRFATYFFPRLVPILVPFYDPAKARMPPNMALALDRYGAMTAA